MPADLRRRDHPALRLDGPRPQQRLPVRLAGPQREGAGERDDLCGAVAPRAPGARLRQRQARLGEAQVEADEAADAADGRVKGPREAGAGLDRGALAEGAVVKDVELVVRCRVVEGALGRDVQGAVEQLLLLLGLVAAVFGAADRRGNVVDADVDGDGVGLGRLAQAEDEGGRSLRDGEV